MPLDLLFLEPREYLTTGSAPAADFAPSLGLMHLAAYVEQELPGLVWSLLDPVLDYVGPEELADAAGAHREGRDESAAERAHRAIGAHLAARREQVLRDFRRDLAATRARVVAIPFNLTRSYADAALLARLARECLPDSRIVVGGNHATCAGEALLAEVPQIDVLVRGEGEGALVDLLRGAPLGSIAGIVYRDGGELRATPARPPVIDLDSYPSPYGVADAFRLHDRLLAMRAWPRNFTRDDGVFSRMVLTARGCPFDCEFCANAALAGRRMRVHSVEYVRDVVRQVRDRFLPWHPAPVVQLADAIFTADRKRTLELARALEPFKVQFHCQTRAECLDAEVIEALRRMGMTCVALGIESLTPAVQARTGKRFGEGELTELVSALHRNGIRATGTFIVGLPGDDEESLLETARAARRCGFDEAYFFPLVAVVGTRTHAELLAQVPAERREWLGRPANREYLYTVRFGGDRLQELARGCEAAFAGRG